MWTGRLETVGLPEESPPDLDVETLHTIQAWRYKPLSLAGVARPALVELSITYSVSSN